MSKKIQCPFCYSYNTEKIKNDNTKIKEYKCANCQLIFNGVNRVDWSKYSYNDYVELESDIELANFYSQPRGQLKFQEKT